MLVSGTSIFCSHKLIKSLQSPARTDASSRKKLKVGSGLAGMQGMVGIHFWTLFLKLELHADWACLHLGGSIDGSQHHHQVSA
jgi:hypothetical protein